MEHYRSRVVAHNSSAKMHCTNLKVGGLRSELRGSRPKLGGFNPPLNSNPGRPTKLECRAVSLIGYICDSLGILIKNLIDKTMTRLQPILTALLSVPSK